MAPNRKSVSTLVQSISQGDLQALQTTVQSKYLPLTDPAEAKPLTPAQPNKKEQQQQQKQQQDSSSYWEWSADVQEDTPKDLFSAENIQSNLIQAAAALTDKTAQSVVSDHDDYWAEPTSAKPTASPHREQKKLGCSYWDWPAEQDSKQATINRILAEDKAYRMVSADRTVATELANAKQESDRVELGNASTDSYWSWESPCVAAHVVESSDATADYWSWDASAAKKEEAEQQPVEEVSRSDMIKAILEYEEARERCTADAIVKQLESAKPVESCATEASNDNYWSWSESLGDQYWDTSARVVSTGQGYWDM